MTARETISAVVGVLILAWVFIDGLGYSIWRYKQWRWQRDCQTYASFMGLWGRPW